MIFQDYKVTNLNINVERNDQEQGSESRGQSHLVVPVEGPSQVGDHNLLHPEKLHQSDRESCFSRSESLVEVRPALEEETLSLAQTSQHQFSIVARESSEGIVGDLLVIQWWSYRIYRDSQDA